MLRAPRRGSARSQAQARGRVVPTGQHRKSCEEVPADRLVLAAAEDEAWAFFQAEQFSAQHQLLEELQAHNEAARSFLMSVYFHKKPAAQRSRKVSARARRNATGRPWCTSRYIPVVHLALHPLLWLHAGGTARAAAVGRLERASGC